MIEGLGLHVAKLNGGMFGLKSVVKPHTQAMDYQDKLSVHCPTDEQDLRWVTPTLPLPGR